MPEIRYFIVTETREVKVSANDPVTAIRLANEAFKNGQDANGCIHRPAELEGVYGDTRSRVRQIDLNVKEGH